jgi:hypothetical protein
MSPMTNTSEEREQRLAARRAGEAPSLRRVLRPARDRLVLDPVGPAFRSARREHTWLGGDDRGGLPFKVIDYEECLGDPPNAHRKRVRLQFVFADKAPTDEELAALLLAGNGGWEADRDGRGATLTPGPGAGYERDNRQVATWFDAMTNGELQALHARFPLVSVLVLNELWFD